MLYSRPGTPQKDLACRWKVLSYGQLVTGLAPIFWPYVDLAWDWLLRDGTQEAVHNIMRGLTIWLAFSPSHGSVKNSWNRCSCHGELFGIVQIQNTLL